MNDMNPMEVDPEKVADMRDQIRQGDYQVEPQAVADAILRHLHELALARQEHVGTDERAWLRARDLHTECSYPESEPVASGNTTPGVPATTRPMTVKPTVMARLANVVSTTLSPDAGTQAQSS